MEMVFKAGQSKRIWNELHKVGRSRASTQALYNPTTIYIDIGEPSFMIEAGQS